MIVTVAGANGNLAVRIIRLLLRKPDVLVRGYARNTAKIPEDIRNHSSFQPIQGQIDDVEKLREAVHGSDVVLCLYQGFEDVMLECQKLLIDICEAEHVDRFFPSSFTSDIRRLKIGQHMRMDNNIKILNYLETKKLRAVHILIGGFIETWLGYSGVIDTVAHTVSFWGTGDEIWDLTSYDNAAAWTAEVIMDKTAEGHLQFVGDRLSPRDLASIYERTSGIKPKLICHGTLDDLYKKMYEEKAKHEGDNPFSYLPLFYTYYTINGTLLIYDPLDNNRYPNVKPVRVEEFLRTHDLSDPKSMQRPI